MINPMKLKENYPSSLADKFTVRMPGGLREKISALAESNHRSMNMEIIARLLDSVGMDEVDTPEVGEKESKYLTAEARLVLAYRALPVKKQRALMEFITE